MRPRRCRPPVEHCLGVRPRKAAKWRADLNSVALATVATMAEAVILPTPGMCSRRSKNPSLKRPGGPVAPGEKSGSRWPLSESGRGRRMKGVELYARVRYAVQIEGVSQREAARRFGIDPRTVAKMLGFSVPPGYRRSRPPVRPKLDPFTGIIDEILA